MHISADFMGQGSVRIKKFVNKVGMHNIICR